MENHIEKENYPDYIEKIYEFEVSPGQASERLDVFLTTNIRNATRNKVQKAIEEGSVTINGKTAKSNKRIKAGDMVKCVLLKPPPIELVPENIPLKIEYEDDYLLVVNKPSGMVTHPAFGNRYGTLVNAVLYHLGYRETIPVEAEQDDEFVEELIFTSDKVRPGIVHRLDKETSGLLLISKNPEIHSQLAKQFAERKVEKIYRALLWGKFPKEHDIYESNIGRSKRDRKLFAVVKNEGKFAKTEFWVEKPYLYMSLVKIKLWTGRTHQIRVHFNHNNHPLVGDRQYGGDTVRFGGNNQTFKHLAMKILENTQGQMLHACSLEFDHPVTGKRILIESELPDNFQSAIEKLDDFQMDFG
jgi:23S rRNA pseudouridine1911/1915/1917 synthase